MGHISMTLLHATLVRHLLTGKSSGTTLGDTLVGHSTKVLS